MHSNIKLQIKKNFEKAAKTYNQYGILQHEVGRRLIDRLEIIKINPKNILDLGSGTGYTSKKLIEKFPEANYFLTDLAFNMLDVSRQELADNNIFHINSDMETLPIAENSMDLIFANLSFQWSFNLEKTIKECYKILKPNGLLIFTTLGIDTLWELRNSWHKVNNSFHHTNQFLDMHNLGDGLMKSNFASPILETKNITLTYSKLIDVMQDLKKIGANTIINSENQKKSLLGKTEFKKLEEEYNKHKINHKLPATYEIIYAHAWKLSDKDKPEAKHPEVSETLIPVEVLLNSKK